jgi:hypothetical protein
LKAYKDYIEKSKYCNQPHSFDVSHIYLSTAIDSIILLDGIVFLVHKPVFYKKMYENYILCAFPFHYSEREESIAIKSLLSQGITVFITRENLEHFTSSPKDRFSDDHIYNIDECLEFWNTVSRQTRKVYNQLCRKYTTVIRHADVVSEEEIAEIKQVTKTWFEDLKGSNKDYGISLYMCYDYLISEAPKVGYLMFQRDEEGKLCAWDYVEVHGDDCLFIQGHSLIPSSFKFITYKLLELAKKLGAKRANIGRAVIFSGDYESAQQTNVYHAKKYFPCKVDFTLFQLDQKKLPSFSTNSLF